MDAYLIKQSLICMNKCTCLIKKGLEHQHASPHQLPQINADICDICLFNTQWRHLARQWRYQSVIVKWWWIKCAHELLTDDRVCVCVVFHSDRWRDANRDAANLRLAGETAAQAAPCLQHPLPLPRPWPQTDVWGEWPQSPQQKHCIINSNIIRICWKSK